LPRLNTIKLAQLSGKHNLPFGGYSRFHLHRKIASYPQTSSGPINDSQRQDAGIATFLLRRRCFLIFTTVHGRAEHFFGPINLRSPIMLFPTPWLDRLEMGMRILSDEAKRRGVPVFS
jgi:hypothetical protein